MADTVTLRSIAQMIDQSLLHPTVTDSQIEQGCKVALKYGVATVCIKPYAIEQVKSLVAGSGVGICAVTAFPHGNSSTTMKIQETLAAIKDGATEIDTVINVGKALGGDWDFLFLGRGLCYPIALEGALKLKEISYIHAEGYPAAEMKHGPIALIDENLPVVVVLQKSAMLLEKTLSNLKEVEARGGQIIAITDVHSHPELKRVAKQVIEVPFVHEYLSPVLLVIPLQLLAYYVSEFNGTDVDLPRNLAKSVTVE